MSSTAAASGLVVFLLSVQVIQSQDGWGVTYSPTEVCALKGSTVEINCSYTYPSRIQHRDIRNRFWFTKKKDREPVDLKTDSEYSGRVEYRCSEKWCSLMIRDLRENDSAEYKFRFMTNQPGGKYTGSPGVTLSVTDPRLQVEVSRSDSTWSLMKCLISCVLPDRPSYFWYKNGQKINTGSSSRSVNFGSLDNYSCALSGYEDQRSPSVYAPKLPSVSVSSSAEIVEDSSVTLTCSSDANPAANYTWYKENQTRPLSEEPHLVFSSIQSSDSGQYYCRAENLMGRKRSESIFIDVKYAPKLPSVSVSSSAEIVEGSSVTLTCSSDANPPANYTWYKENQMKLQGPESVYRFTSISSHDSGNYHCQSENQYRRINSTSLVLDVQYAPKLPSVSVSSSAEIVEGSSVTLTCSSDANPPANYTWYKKNEDSPKASGQIFNITDFRAEHSGSYYCEAQNNRGRSNSTLHLTVVADKTTMIIRYTRWTLVVVIPILLLLVCLWMRKKKALSSTTEPHEPIETVEVRQSYTLILTMRTTQTLQHREKTQRSRKTRCEGQTDHFMWFSSDAVQPEGDSPGWRQKEVH
ncbi:B-cell receptor CD22-like isoform X1 [Cebidichthys violaceus]|uniref:B-cell receptor CD22-like isoform X1 n=1 Tax=Cebidichthys violaceus TaxID=271503 RepID=UPI0035C95F18